MSFPEGQTFQVSDGSLTISELGELISEFWMKAHPSVPMYPTGTPSDEVSYPVVVWGVANRRRMNSVKDRTTDEFIGDDGRPYTKKIGEYRCVLEVRISADTPLEANQLIEAFERFIGQYVGAFKKAGIREMLYSERLPDSFEKIAGKVISHRTVQYEVHEQLSFIEGGPYVEDILIRAHAFNDDDTSDMIESRVESV